MHLIRLCARVCHVCKNEEIFVLFVNVFLRTDMKMLKNRKRLRRESKANEMFRLS